MNSIYTMIVIAVFVAVAEVHRSLHRGVQIIACAQTVSGWWWRKRPLLLFILPVCCSQWPSGQCLASIFGLWAELCQQCLLLSRHFESNFLRHQIVVVYVCLCVPAFVCVCVCCLVQLRASSGLVDCPWCWCGVPPVLLKKVNVRSREQLKDFVLISSLCWMKLVLRRQVP